MHVGCESSCCVYKFVSVSERKREKEIENVTFFCACLCVCECVKFFEAKEDRLVQV